MARFAVLVFPGTNCEGDVHHAIEAVTGQPAELVWHKEGSLDGFDAAVVPGGFAHGDYLRAGGLARFSPVMEPLIRMAESGRAVVGICNGFQILQEAGLLPGAMLRNESLSYVCRDVRLRVEANSSPLTCGLANRAPRSGCRWVTRRETSGPTTTSSKRSRRRSR